MAQIFFFNYLQDLNQGMCKEHKTTWKCEISLSYGWYDWADHREEINSQKE